jgi:hypothetical protein
MKSILFQFILFTVLSSLASANAWKDVAKTFCSVFALRYTTQVMLPKLLDRATTACLEATVEKDTPVRFDDERSEEVFDQFWSCLQVVDRCAVAQAQQGGVFPRA